jgi:hypothetical protein
MCDRNLFYPEDGGIMFLWNVIKSLPDYIVTTSKKAFIFSFSRVILENYCDSRNRRDGHFRLDVNEKSLGFEGPFRVATAHSTYVFRGKKLSACRNIIEGYFHLIMLQGISWWESVGANFVILMTIVRSKQKLSEEFVNVQNVNLLQGGGGPSE